MGPVLLTLYGNEFYDNAEQRLLTPTVTYAKESVLIIYDDNDDIKIYSTSGNTSFIPSLLELIYTISK